MFTLGEINEIHNQFGRADTLPQYLRSLKAVGVRTYDSFIFDGHSEYFGSNGYCVISPPVHPVIAVVETSNQHKFLEHLNLHKQQKTSYLEMSQGLADSGVKKWTFDTDNMTLTYFDTAENEMLVETIL
jgi:uncharacterized protein YbcV (DUF1398 family)